VRIPRVKCKKDGVRQIVDGIADPNSKMTYEFERLVIDFEKECSLESISRLLDIDWHLCRKIQERAVERGKSRKGESLPERIGVDEKSFAKRHKYETLVYDIDNSVVEDVIDKNEQESLESYYRKFSLDQRNRVKSVSMDMWDAYIAATKRYIPGAEDKIVFDRYHATRVMTEAVDKVRKQEHKKLLEKDIDILKGTKYLWITNKENVPDFRKNEFNYLRSRDLKVCKAHAIKENLRNLWNYKSKTWMHKFFKGWYYWATHSRIKPVIKAAKTLNNHITNILTYADHKVTNATGESINSKIEKMKRLSCGFRSRKHYRIAIFFHCGGLDLYPRRTNTAYQILG